MGQEVTSEIEFQAWPKIYRLNREVIVTEKIDGTNACIIVGDDGEIHAQSRTRLIAPGNDNFGFAAWVFENAEELAATLGPGRHFGEWWGSGIQRNYGLPKGEKRFSLFNALRWSVTDCDGFLNRDYRCTEAPLCFVVPKIALCHEGHKKQIDDLGFSWVNSAVKFIRKNGSLAAKGFMNPEGVIAYHKQSNSSFKVTCEKDEEYKGRQQ